MGEELRKFGTKSMLCTGKTGVEFGAEDFTIEILPDGTVVPSPLDIHGIIGEDKDGDWIHIQVRRGCRPRWLWRLVCWRYGHVEPEETFFPRANLLSYSCARCGKWIAVNKGDDRNDH